MNDILLGVQQDLRQVLVSEHLAEDHAGVEGDLLVPVAIEGGEQDVRFGTEILDGGEPRADLPPEQIVEDLDHILARLELELVDVQEQVVQQVGAVRLLRELRHELGQRVCARGTHELAACCRVEPGWCTHPRHRTRST